MHGLNVLHGTFRDTDYSLEVLLCAALLNERMASQVPDLRLGVDDIIGHMVDHEH